MKKFLLGLTSGVILSTTTAAYASGTIQTYLFPLKFVINGEAKKAEGYQTLNYDGHAYMPIRFIAESMGAKVSYDEASQTIKVDNGFNIIDINNREVNAGHLSIMKEGDHSVINGQLFIGQNAWDRKFIEDYQSMMKTVQPGLDTRKTDVSGNLAFCFWNEKEN